MSTEHSIYERIFRLQWEIDEMLLIQKSRNPEEFSRILDGIIEGKEICTGTDLLMPKHKQYRCRFKDAATVYKRILVQRSVVIRLMVERVFTASSYYKVLHAFKEGKKICLSAAILAAQKGMQELVSAPAPSYTASVAPVVPFLPPPIVTAPPAYVMPVIPDPPRPKATTTPRHTNAIQYLQTQGIPVFEMAATEQLFGVFFSSTEKAKLQELREHMAEKLYQKIMAHRFSIMELTYEQAYIAVMPGILSLNAIRQKVNRFRAGIWYHNIEFAQVPTEVGVILGFGKPFALKETLKEQKRRLLEYSQEKGISFRPARTCEEIIGWLLDSRQQTPEGMMYNGYVRTADVFEEGDKRWRVCVGNFNLGGIHVDKKDAGAYEHIGISRCYKLLMK